MSNPRSILVAVATASAILVSAGAGAQEAKHYRFAYDQPKTTGYGILGDIFADKLKALSKGTMLIDQYPGAQLGQEPQVLQLVKAGDVEFCISASANAATRWVRLSSPVKGSFRDSLTSCSSRAWRSLLTRTIPWTRAGRPSAPANQQPVSSIQSTGSEVEVRTPYSMR